MMRVKSNYPTVFQLLVNVYHNFRATVQEWHLERLQNQAKKDHEAGRVIVVNSARDLDAYL